MNKSIGPKTNEEWIELAKNVNETHNELKKVVSMLNKYYYYDNTEYDKNQKRILRNMIQRSSKRVKDMNIAAGLCEVNIRRKTDPIIDKFLKEKEEYYRKLREVV